MSTVDYIADDLLVPTKTRPQVSGAQIVLLVLNDLMVDAGAARVSLPCNLIFFNFFYRPERLVQYRVLYTVPGYNRAREQIASSSGTIRWFRRPHCTVPAERDLAILIYIYI